MVVYKVLSIYRVLPGFREFAVFEKSERFLRKVSDFSTFFLDECYIEGVRALARAQIFREDAFVSYIKLSVVSVK